MDKETLSAATGCFVVGPLTGLAFWAILWLAYKLATS